MFKALVVYLAIVTVLAIAMIASRRNALEPVRHRSVLQRWRMPEDTQ